ncbi:MAG: ABC transporter ATP-binding protein [Phycisphaerales bacterium JB059]
MSDPRGEPARRPDDASAPLLEVRDLAVSFANGRGPRIQAVDGVSMTIHPRQTLAVVGESGCGKSVTALTTLGLIPSPPACVDRGTIRFNEGDGPVNLLGLDARAMRRVRGGKIAMIFQEPMTSLNPVFSIGDQLVEAIVQHQAVRKGQAREIAVESMREVGIPDPGSRLSAYPHQFSGGMRQRVMIAMALACRPRLLLADEPTTALDVTIQAQILDLLDGLKRTRGMGVMLITHDLGVVREQADVVCVMYAGRVVEYGDCETVFADPLHPYTRGLLACIPRMHDRRERLQTVRDLVEDEGQFTRLGSDRRPWWPWHEAPEGVDRGASCLAEITPGHWVGLWASEGARAMSVRDVDVIERRGVVGSALGDD